MKRVWLAGMVLVLAVGSPALAFTRHHSVTHWGDGGGGGWGTFSAATLNGTYIFQGSGFADDGKAGEVAVLGTLTFDGVSAVAGNLILTHGNSSQNSCNDTFTTGMYSFTGGSGAPGQFTMQIPLSTSNINFGLLVPDPEGHTALAIQSDNGALDVAVCGSAPIVSMSLKGKLKRLDEGFGGDD